jgi:hypothetical protein
VAKPLAVNLLFRRAFAAVSPLSGISRESSNAPAARLVATGCLTTDHQVFCGKFVNGFSNGSPDTRSAQQFHLALGISAPGFHSATYGRFEDQYLYLLVQRAEYRSVPHARRSPARQLLLVSGIDWYLSYSKFAQRPVIMGRSHRRT